MMLWLSGFVLSFLVLSISTSDLDPCVSYKELRDSKRSQFHSIAGMDRVQCDRDLTLDWYRFKGRAGLKMPESCVKSGYCGTHSPGWFHGSHPTKEGDVSTGRVCFNFMGSCCEWYMSTKVKKCNGFFVYNLPPTLYCDLQYCGDGAPDLDCAADNNDITVNGSTPGSLSSPNFPRQYPNSLQCSWRITAPAGMKVKLILKNLTLGPNDYITFRDGVRDNSEQIAKYADGASGELRLFSTDRYMLVNFASDASEPGIGFRLEYESVVSDKVQFFPYKDICSPSANITSLSGNIRSPGMPGSPSGNLECHWNLNFPIGYKVLIQFSWFGLAKKENQSHCTGDYVGFRTDGEAQSRAYCGSELPPKRIYNSRNVYVTFNNSQAANRAGFLFHYRALAADECMDGVDSCQTKIGAVGMNKNGDLSFESLPVEPTSTSPLLSTAATTKTTNQEDFAMDVKCDKDKINVILHIKSFPRLDPKSIHLSDASCKPYFQNNTHIFIKSTLEGCGMAWNISEDGKMIIYRNAITIPVRSQSRLGSYATRDHQAVFEFQCSYRRRAVLSAVSFDPSKIFVITDIESFGNFTFEMHLFKSGNFKEYYTVYPVGPINVGSDIFLQVSVTSRDSGIIVFVDECKATPLNAYNDPNQFIFLEDGCPKDNTLRYNYSLSSVQRLTLSAFRFSAVKSKEIFLHCLVKACLRSDSSSRCAEGCKYGKRRKRASGEEIERRLAVGPIIVSPNPTIEGTESISPKESTRILIGIVAGLLGFIAVLLLAALVSVICRRRKKHISGAATLLVVRKNEPGPG